MKKIMTLAATLVFLLAATVADAQETQQPSAADFNIIAERASRNAGGARRARARNDAYDRAFDDCMRGITPYQ